MSAEPSLPYAGTSGWSGSETSRERAAERDGTGITADQQQAVVVWLNTRGPLGATWVEVGEYLHCHHGSASSVLSTLHKDGRIARLTSRRDKSLVYVHLDHVANRQTEKQGRIRISEEEREMCQGIRDRVIDDDPIEDFEIFTLLRLIDRLA